MAVRTLDVWRDRAACRGPETALFFPPSTTERRDDREARERRAKAICKQCEVRRECLDYAEVRGGRPETFSGLAGIGDLTATILAPGSRNRRGQQALEKRDGGPIFPRMAPSAALRSRRDIWLT